MCSFFTSEHEMVILFYLFQNHVQNPVLMIQKTAIASKDILYFINIFRFKNLHFKLYKKMLIKPWNRKTTVRLKLWFK